LSDEVFQKSQGELERLRWNRTIGNFVNLKRKGVGRKKGEKGSG